MSDLSLVRIGDICLLKAGNAFPKEQQGVTLGDVPFIKVSDFELPGNERRITRANNFLSEATARDLKVKRHRKGGVAFAKIGIALTYNRRRLLTRDTAVDNNLMVAEAIPELCDDIYFYYLLRTVDFNLIANGSALPYLNASDIRNIEVAIHTKSEQKAIAHILGILDDKIELNRKTNETLEAMAKALFKSWFVDFDPVRAKAEGRPTGLPAEISDLFPDSFEDSELGEIPSGWEIALLGDHIDLIKGRSYKSDELNPSTTALVTLKSFQRNGGYRPDGLKGFTGEHKEQQVVKPGELVIALTDVTQAADVIGRPAIVKSDSHCSSLVASLDVGIVRPKATGCFSTPYLYFLMLTPRYVQHILGYTSGTTVLHLAKDGASNLPLPIGSLSLLNHFAQLADSILRQVDASARQSELLAKTRDALLPKLISGEIRIPDAEKMLEEVGV